MFNSLLDKTPKDSTRARRFAICIPVRYRQPHTARWFDGRTENISYSGVLFRAECLLQPKTTVELKLELPAAILGEAPGKVVCKGVVVRREGNHRSDNPPALAVSIGGYRVTRGDKITGKASPDLGFGRKQADDCRGIERPVLSSFDP